ncbi:hypothetical protein CDD80_7272 [Ophiocordyceps camponoti-rufipedis]|uniref:Uncharacterized protein n=1 Tax=Ophiocordyceps camponoti-rufipedis TaxID=2004952 RepID=A0A2C5YGW7_9HYPO|nr:hypothetical protein CDD80_7272 [Ophiocordyceps camponoti-rufipedis]
MVEMAARRFAVRISNHPLLRESLGLSRTRLTLANLYTENEFMLESVSRMPVRGRTCKIKTSSGNVLCRACLHNTAPGHKHPILAIEYKAPHKLSFDDLSTSLASEIQPKRDIMHQPAPTAKKLAASAIAQLSSYMSEIGVRYGYLTTGQSIVFVKTGEDPSTVEVAVRSVHHDAVQQLFAFYIHALAAEPVTRAWRERVEEMELWPVDWCSCQQCLERWERMRMGNER